MARYATAILAAMGFAAGGWLTAAAQVTTPPADDERVIDGRSDDVGKADVPGGDAEATTQHDADRPAPPAGVEEAPKGAIDRENRERKTPDADAAADVNRNDLGMQFRFDEDADERISVQSVDEDGRAWQAGFREGDQIITVDGRTYDSEDKLRTFLNRRSDRRIPFVVERNGEQRTLYWSADAGYDAKTDRFNDRNDREDAIGRRDHDLKKHDREADVSGRAAIGVHLVDTQWGPHVSHVVEGS
ncbi:MAG: PDZ domain-containing protein, partial [Planctomycetes bacterium]|nr:PDZ domain-containing protein [Planctomycetota bacterium]